MKHTHQTHPMGSERPIPRRRAVAGPTRLVATIAMVALVACSGATDTTENRGPNAYTNVPAPVGGVAQFTVLPTAIAAGQSLTALGSLNPPGHVLPTDHVYFYDGDLAAGHPFGSDTRDVFMPTTGAVFFIYPGSNGESKVAFRATPAFYFYFDHIVLGQSLTIGQVVQVGTKIGTTSPGSTLDLGAFDTTAVHTGFLNRARYAFQTLYAVSPWKYMSPALQAQIYPHVYRATTAADRDGRIDFGIDGHLAGDWFLDGMPVDSSAGPFGWTRTLSFAYDYYDPSQVRISIGGTIGPAGVWAIDSTAPRPETITPSSGIVPYLLYSQFDKGFPPYGLLLVQMTGPATLKAQLFPNERTTNRTFDATATTFVR